jgi:fatty-acyl-CoA synthase
MNLSTWIERWADFQPNKTALHFEGRDITYRALYERVLQFADILGNQLGVRPTDRVALLGYNSADVVALVFACARLGAIFVPLNWRLVTAEILVILKDCGPRLFIVEPAFVEVAVAARSANPDILILSRGPNDAGIAELDRPAEVAASSIDRDVGDIEAALLIMYTSGTTGAAKGAVLSQKGMLWNAINSAHAHDLCSTSHVLTNLPLFHVGGLAIQTLPALHAGATVTLEKRFEPAAALDTIAKRRPNHLLAVPATMKAMIDHPNWAGADLSSLELVMTGASTVPESLIRSFNEKGISVGQIFGATEMGPIAIYLRRGDADRKIGSIGKPAVHCEVKLVDELGRAVQEGEAGEVLVRSPALMIGYWENETETRKAIRDGWFYTGDIAQRDADGYFFIQGRMKDVIISGGENVYPAEIENILYNCPEISDAAVVGKPDDRWVEIPVAFVVR